MKRDPLVYLEMSGLVAVLRRQAELKRERSGNPRNGQQLDALADEIEAELRGEKVSEDATGEYIGLSREVAE